MGTERTHMEITIREETGHRPPDRRTARSLSLALVPLCLSAVFMSLPWPRL